MKRREFSKKLTLRLNKSTIVNLNHDVNLNPDEMQQVNGGVTTAPCGGKAITDAIYTLITPIFWC